MKHSLVCVICLTTFVSSWSHKRVCSENCRKERNRQLTGRYADKSISGGTVGAISELEIAADLMKKGYAVFRALSPTCYCDIIAMKSGKILAVEARTGYKSLNNKIYFPLLIRKEADIFGIFVRTSNEVIYFKKDAKTQIQL